MKLQPAAIFLIALGTGLLAAATAGAQPFPAGQAGYRGVQPAGGASPMFVDPAVVYAGYGGCDACDAYGNSIDPGSSGCSGCSGCSRGSSGCSGCSGGPGGCGPIGAGGWGSSGGYDQCGPHYFDLSADFLYWRRDKSADPSFPTTSLGIDGPRVLGTSDLELDWQPAFRVTGRFDLGPATIVEATYYGMFEWFDTAQVVSETGQLFSIFTKFGTDPFGGVGFEETDRANLHRLDYFSELHNAEINWRQYWVCDAPCITGTWLMGARYVRVTEDFVFRTRVDGPPPSGMDYFVSTENDLVGFQIGGDSAACLLQGLRVVAEGKVGIYNNRAKQNTLVVATTLSPNRVEAADGDRVAFVGEGRVGVVADILPSWSVRAGYEVLYLNSIALAGNNFNPENPFVPGDRNVFLNDGGSALYHGAYGGLELVW